MLDSGSSANIMTRKFMEQLNLKITRPYHNICAMESREVKVVGIVLGFPVQMDILVIDVPDKWGM